MERKLIPKKMEVVTDEPTEPGLNEQQFFSLLLGAKLIGHVLHLQTKEFATHIALDEFYKGSQKNADKIIEVYQGASSTIVQYESVYMTEGMFLEPLEYLTQLRAKICDNRYDIVPKELSNVHNEIDNFISTIDTAVYKITFLK